MTDREMLDTLLAHLGRKIESSDSQYVEIQNSMLGEDIVFEFDENGNITDIYS